jgi:glycosyltransferase involved in cell wall biosynthesis
MADKENVEKIYPGIPRMIAERDRIPKKPPLISCVKEGIERPLWSVMIPVYNCSKFLEEVLTGVLSQDPGEQYMQIEVVDDASNDANVGEIVFRIGKGRINYFRHQENLGSLRNFQVCIERARGYLVHILHGDDRVRNGFYSKFSSFFESNPDVGAAFCRYAYIDESGRFLYNHEVESDREGILSHSLRLLCERQRIQYVSMVVKRKVYEQLGSFYGVEYGEDWEMWVRIAVNYPIGYIPTVLADYRRHLSTISGKSFLTAQNMRDLETVMEKVHRYLPESERKLISDRSKRFYAHYALRVANTLWSKLRHKSGAIAQARAAWRMKRDPGLLFKIAKLFIRVTLNI